MLQADEDKVKLYRISILLYPLKDQMLSEYLQTNNGYNDADIVIIPFIERLIERGIFDKKYEWFRHELIKKCYEDDLGEEQKKRYHNRTADFYLVGCANHLHNAGRYDESYIYNVRLADYASTTIGDLHLAERCYKMAIDDAMKLGNLERKIKCIHNLSWYVYHVWGRYNEASDNYRYVLKYYKHINDRPNQSMVLNNIGLIYENKGEYDAALDKYNESLKIRRQLADKGGIANSLNNLGYTLISRGKFEEALPHVLVFSNILS